MEDREARQSQVAALVSPALESQGLVLVDAEWRREGRRWVLRLYVDKAGGVSVADCQRVSHEVGDLLDVSGLIEEPYDLEVSSPGLDRQLRTDREFEWAVGKEVRCWVREPVAGRMELVGRLVACTAEHLILAHPEGWREDVPRRLVTKARLEFAFPRKT